MLTLRRPQHDLWRVAREFDSLFSNPWRSDNGRHTNYAPAVDVTEEEERYVLSADLPGIDEKDVEVTVHQGVLVLSGKRDQAEEQPATGGHYRERSYGSFCRQFRLGSKVDAEKIEAAYKNGVLTVSIPKKEEIKPRQIPVSTS